MASNVMTPIGTLYFPSLFVPKVNKENPNQGARYSHVLLFDSTAVQSTAYQNLRAAIREAIAEKWGEMKANDPAFVRTLRSPLRPASEKSYAGFENGETFISAWSKGDEQAPGVVDLKGAKIMVPDDVWQGQYARSTVRPFAYDASGNKGVGFYLEHVQIVKADMPRLDNKRSAEAAFGNAAADSDAMAQMAALGIDPAGGGASGARSNDEMPF